MTLVLERIPGKDYSAGWARYGFAAPFSKKDATVPTHAMPQEVV